MHELMKEFRTDDDCCISCTKHASDWDYIYVNSELLGVHNYLPASFLAVHHIDVT